MTRTHTLQTRTLQMVAALTAPLLMATLTLFLTLLMTATPLSAQLLGGDGSATTGGLPGSKTILEGIAAIVGNKIILISDVIQRSTLIKAQSKGMALSDEQLYQEVLNDLIVNNLLLVRAEEDSITVSDDIVNSQLDERISQLVQQVGGSSSVLEEYYGKPISEIRAEAKPIIKDQLMVEFLRRQHFSDLKVTERDMEEFYRQYQDSLPEVPEQLEIARILILEKPSKDAEEKAIALAEKIIDSLKAGGDFAEFARRYSIDPGSAAKGGEVGWVARGRFVKEYEDAAWGMNINELSAPVVSKYGVHIIQLLDKRDDETRSRHILLPLKADESQKQAIVDTLNSLRKRALAGESFATLAATYSDDEESKYNSGIVVKYPIDQLPTSYQWIPDSLKVGEISSPRPVRSSPTESGYHIIKLTRVIPPHAVNLTEDREQIEQLATLWKQNQKLLEWVAELRKQIYWEIKYDFK